MSLDAAPPVAFMFPGQGAQHAGMASELYAAEPVFAACVDRCCDALTTQLEVDPRDVFFRGQASPGDDRAERIDIAQPALFVVSYALARLWQHWGVHPAAMIGHSVGELVAACLAGVFTEAGALSVVAARGRLLQSLPSGAMLAIPLPESEVAGLLDDDRLAIAAVNGPSWVVVAGSQVAVDTFEQRLTRRRVPSKRLHIERAGHSPMTAAVAPALRDRVAAVDRGAPTIPYVSNLSGTWATPEEAVDPETWARHLRHAVRFADGVGTLLRHAGFLLLEVGPGRTLATYASRHPDRDKRHAILTSLPHPKDEISDLESMLTAAEKLWRAGVPFDIDSARRLCGSRTR